MPLSYLYGHQHIRPYGRYFRPDLGGEARGASQADTRAHGTEEVGVVVQGGGQWIEEKRIECGEGGKGSVLGDIDDGVGG